MANQRFGQTYHRQQQHTIGLGELDSSGEILRADRLREAALHKLNSDPMAVLTLSTASNGEDWEWCDEHLYLDISQTPVGNPDPPVDATITQLQDALQQGAKELAEAKNFTVNGCDEARIAAQQLSNSHASLHASNDMLKTLHRLENYHQS